jgi:hypothetical protein
MIPPGDDKNGVAAGSEIASAHASCMPASRRPLPRNTGEPAMRDRPPWRSAGTGVVSLVTPVGFGMFHPSLGMVFGIIEVVVALTIIGMALFGSQTLSERAFRFLRWIRNRPEPPTPTG